MALIDWFDVAYNTNSLESVRKSNGGFIFKKNYDDQIASKLKI